MNYKTVLKAVVNAVIGESLVLVYLSQMVLGFEKNATLLLSRELESSHLFIHKKNLPFSCVQFFLQNKSLQTLSFQESFSLP
jgi:hypothetical protein